MEIKDNTFSRQFETIVNGKQIAIEYVIQERKLFLTKIVDRDSCATDEDLEQFLNIVLEIVVERKLKVVPTFPKIVQFFRKNPKHKELLPPGIRI